MSVIVATKVNVRGESRGIPFGIIVVVVAVVVVVLLLLFLLLFLLLLLSLLLLFSCCCCFLIVVDVDFRLCLYLLSFTASVYLFSFVPRGIDLRKNRLRLFFC